MRLDTRFRNDILPIDFKVTSITPTTTTLLWRLKDFHDGCPAPAVTGYNIYYNEVPNRYYVKLNDEPITTTTFAHNTAKYSKFPRGYYVVEGILEDGSCLKTQVYDIYPPYDLTSDKVAKQELFYVMYRHNARIDTVPVFIYGRKGFGNDKCKCTAEGMGPLKAKCPVCLGTGFLGGYHEPVLGYVSYQSPFGKSQTHQGPRLSQESQNNAIIAVEFCIVNPDDYVREVEPPFRLFCVNGVTVTENGSVPLLQFCSLQLEESGHPLWQRPIPNIIFPKNIYYNKVCREL